MSDFSLAAAHMFRVDAHYSAHYGVGKSMIYQANSHPLCWGGRIVATRPHGIFKGVKVQLGKVLWLWRNIKQKIHGQAPTTKYADLVDQHPLMLFFGSVTSLAGVWWMSYLFLNTYSVITFCLPMKYETQPKEAEEVVKMAIDSTLVKQGSST